MSQQRYYPFYLLVLSSALFFFGLGARDFWAPVIGPNFVPDTKFAVNFVSGTEFGYPAARSNNPMTGTVLAVIFCGASTEGTAHDDQDR